MDIVPLKIVGAKLGNQAGIYGAYLIAKNSLQRQLNIKNVRTVVTLNI